MRVITFLAVSMGIFASLVNGQETRGTIFGRVLDPQASPVPGANVTVRNENTNVSINLTANDLGYFEASLLIAGRYVITAEAPGFKKSIRSGVTLPVGTRLQIDISMELGTQAESISVKAEAPLLETASVSAGLVMDNKNVMQLPALGNNPMLLVMLTPGIQASGVNKYNSLHTLGGASEYNSYGGVGGNDWSIDGAPNTRGRSMSFMPAADAVQEFKVDTNNFDASVGHSTGAFVSMMTKAGTNALHGTLTEQHWQQRWNGTPFFIKQQYYREIAAAETRGDTELANFLRSQDKQPSGRSNRYTATLGGPVVIPRVFNGRNKLFFFLSYAGFRDQKRPEGGVINRTLPTLAERQGDFSQLLNVDPIQYQIHDPLSVRPDPARPTHFIRDPFPNNRIPRSRFHNPAYDNYVKLLPVPNNDPTSPRLEARNNYIASRMPFDWSYWQFSNRVDYHHSEKHRFFGSWNLYDFIEDRNDWTYETARGLHSDGFAWSRPGGTVNWLYTAGPATIFDFTVAASQYKNTVAISTPYQFSPSSVGLPAYLDAKAGNQAVLPRMVFSGYETLGRFVPDVTRNTLFSGKAEVSHVRGAHTLRAGVDVRQYLQTRYQWGNTSGSFSFSNAFTRRYDDLQVPAGDLGHSWASFILGLPNDISIVTNDSWAIHSPFYGWFLQDNWRLTPKLSLNLGLRMEYERGATERFNRAIGHFDSSAALPISEIAEVQYGRNPVPELSASAFRVRGGSIYPLTQGLGRVLTRGELMFLPRIGAAYQLTPKSVLRAGYGVYFDTLNVYNLGIRQINYSRTTSTIVTDDFGMTWGAGDPRNGISPLRDPFPLRADGTRFDEPTRDALGLMASAGRSYTFPDYDTRRSRQQRWRIGLQQQLGSVMVFEVAYAGTYADRVYVTRNLNPLPERFWADGLVRNNAVASNMNSSVANPFHLVHYTQLAMRDPLIYQEMSRNTFFTSPFIRKNSLLRPFPHLTGLAQANGPFGEVRTHALEVQFQRRLSKGLNLNFGYTRLSNRESDIYLNEFDLEPSWRESNDGRPHRIVATGIWELPFGRGRAFLQRGLGNHLLGGWQFAATYEYQPGPLLDFGNVFYYGELSAIAQGSRTLDRWFNTDNFERVAARGPNLFHRRVFPTRVDNVRQDATNQWNMNIMRELKLGERAALQLRLDTINTFNRSQFAAPDLNPFSTNFGRIVAQTTATNRIVQIVGRIQF